MKTTKGKPVLRLGATLMRRLDAQLGKPASKIAKARRRQLVEVVSKVAAGEMVPPPLKGAKGEQRIKIAALHYLRDEVRAAERTKTKPAKLTEQELQQWLEGTPQGWSAMTVTLWLRAESWHDAGRIAKAKGQYIGDVLSEVIEDGDALNELLRDVDLENRIERKGGAK